MEAMRRGGDALRTRNLHGFQRGGKHVFKQQPFVGRKLAEHVADHFAGLAATDADFKARKDIGPEMLNDGFDPIVTTRRAFFAEAERAERQGDIVVDDQHLFGWPLVEGEDLVNGAAAQVHKRLRFQQNRAAAGEFGEVALPLRSRLESRAFCGGQAIQYHESHVVAGVLVLLAGVAEADDE